MTETILREDRDGVALLTLNRPEKRNAITLAMIAALGEHVRAIGRDAHIRVVVLAGNGPHFCAGGDMAEMLEHGPVEGDDKMIAWQDGLEAIERSTKPVICAVHGAAFGGGTEIAIACHVRVCADDARFAQTEIALDHMPGGGGTQRLPRLIALGAAYEHLLLGEPIDAANAYRIGLVNHVWPRAELRARALDLAARVAARGRPAIRYTMEAIRLGLMGPPEVGNRIERAFASLVTDTREAREGIEQFLAKTRRPAG